MKVQCGHLRLKSPVYGKGISPSLTCSRESNVHEHTLGKEVKLLYFVLFSFSRGRERGGTRQKVTRDKQLQTVVLASEMIESDKSKEKVVTPIHLRVNALVWARNKSIFSCSICSSGAEKRLLFLEY